MALDRPRKKKIGPKGPFESFLGRVSRKKEAQLGHKGWGLRRDALERKGLNLDIERDHIEDLGGKSPVIAEKKVRIAKIGKKRKNLNENLKGEFPESLQKRKV